jgi:two-component system sensor histidine kinase RegB
MDAPVLQRVFEPFFTTKAPGKGMGLGLYLARNVVSNLGGSLTLDSRPGSGTVARMLLPKERFRLQPS